MQVLQIVAVDVPTHSHLGVCLAVRVSEAVALLNSHNIPSEGSDCERVKYSSYEIEHTILVNRMGKKCKQRFLKADRKDSYISKSRRGYGGNVAALMCMTIAQERIPSEVIQQFRDGENFSLLFTYRHVLLEFVKYVVE